MCGDLRNGFLNEYVIREDYMETVSIVDLLLSGASLSSVMVPDPRLASNYPAHDETYKFKYIYIDGNRFFAQTSTTHRPIRTGESYSLEHCFSYSVGYNEMMMVTGPNSTVSIWGHIPSRYAEFSWKVRDDHKLVWSTTNRDFSALREAVQMGEEFKIAITDESGVESIMSVDIINVDHEKDDFFIRTEMGVIPSPFLDAESLITISGLMKKQRDVPECMVHLDSTQVPKYYVCTAGGIYADYLCNSEEIVKNYRDLKIFVPKRKKSNVYTFSYADSNQLFSVV